MCKHGVQAWFCGVAGTASLAAASAAQDIAGGLGSIPARNAVTPITVEYPRPSVMYPWMKSTSCGRPQAGGGTPQAATANPVDLSDGFKLESAVDFSLPLAGIPFNLVREYTSDETYSNGQGVGNNWAVGFLRGLRVDVAGSNATASFDGTPDGRGLYKWTSFDADGQNELEGGSNAILTATTVVVNSVKWPVWKVSTPGQGSACFIRETDGVVDDPGDTIAIGDEDGRLGLLIVNADLYGNRHEYEYSELEIDPNSEVEDDEFDLWSPVNIRCYTATNQLQARVSIHWNSTDGLLGAVKAWRPVGDSEPVEVQTHQVFYTYLADDSKSWLGSKGDLVQVQVDERVDPAPGAAEPDEPVWYSRITQYRYHAGVQEMFDEDEDGYAEENGGDQMLKMVINPQQVEYYAQRRAEDAEALSSVADFADDLMELADGDPDEDAGNLRPVDLASKVVPQYLAYGKVGTQHILIDCGCGSSGQRGLRQTFTYHEYTVSSVDYRTTWVTESYHNGSAWVPNLTRIYDFKVVGTGGSGPQAWYVVNSVITEGGMTPNADPSSGQYWVTHYQYSTDGLRTLDRMYTPSATDEYVPYWRELPPPPGLGSTDHAPTYTVKSADGLVYAYEYDGNARRTEVRLHQGEPSGNGISSYQLVEATEYSTTSGEEHLVAAVKRVRTDGETLLSSVAAENVEVTTYSYGFHSETDHAIAWIKTSVEAETTSENGPGGNYDSWELYDTRGLNTWSIAADGSYTKRVFDNEQVYPTSVSRTGQVVSVIRNADTSIDGYPTSGALPSSPPSDRYAEGGSLTDGVTRDVLGRVQATTGPGGVKHAVAREMRASDDRPYMYYLAQVSFPFEYASAAFDGPAKITWLDASGRSFASRGYLLDASYSAATQTNEYRQVYSDYSLDDEVSRSLAIQHTTGVVAETRMWHDVANPTTGYYVTRYDYDALGRMSVVTGPMDPPTPASSPDPEILAPGTRHKTEYDFMGRVATRSVSSTASGAAWEVVERRYYDSQDVMGTETEGVGNGNLTFIVRPVSDSSGDNRETRVSYDWRDRAVGTLNPLAPHRATSYDNLNRPVLEATVSGSSASTNWSATDTNRVGLQRKSYSQRGHNFRNEAAIDPSRAVGSATWLASDRWSDAVRRTVGERSPSRAGTKTTFDGLGRITASYQVDNDGFGTFADVFASNASIIGSHKVIEQAEMHYLTASHAAKGQVDLVTTRRRTHESTATGALSQGTAAVSMFHGHFYDAAGRETRTANYGTALSTFSGGTPTEIPNPSQSSPPNTGSTGTNVSVTAFNARGLVESTTDNGGSVTKRLYDSLGRPFAMIENYVDATVTWGTAPDGDRWLASNVGSTDGTDRVTSSVFNASGRVVKYVAHQAQDEDPGDRDQVTEYTYGVSDADTDPSALWSHELLLSVTYPDEGVATYAYNRQGEVIHTKDQNATEHVFTRDDLGRATEDLVSDFGTDIDQSIHRITREYHPSGQLKRVKSIGASSVVRNDVWFEYTPLQQVEKVWQNSLGAIPTTGTSPNFVPEDPPSGTARLVKYTYSTSASGSDNYSRLSAVDYPRNVNSSGSTTATLEYLYTSDLNDSISRVDALEIDGSTQVVKYDYIGADVFAQVDYPGPGGETDVQLDFTADRNGERRTQGFTTGDVGAYPNLDRFGRVISQDWVDGDYTVHGSSGALPDRTQIVALGYGYDAGGNRTRAVDARPGSQWKHSFEYSYDGLHRLTEAERGNWTGSTLTSVAGSQQWTLDALGNWSQWKSDWSYNGSYGDPETQNRTHNMVNELTDIDIPTSPVAVTEDFGYDANGNIRTHERDESSVLYNDDFRYTYDAWNRLVKVEGGSEWELDELEQQFNGLNWRTWKHSDTLPRYLYNETFEAYFEETEDGILDETHVYTYNASWQLIEERIDATLEGVDDRVVQHVWGIRYIDDPVLHRRDTGFDGDYGDTEEGDGTYYHLTDAMFSTVALISDTASVVERVTYDPYGMPLHHPGPDLNGDGVITSTGNTPVLNDLKAITNTNSAHGPVYWSSVLGGSNNYSGVGDLNRDGTIDGTDLGIFYGHGGAWLFGRSLSSVDNVAGFDGYIYDPEVAMYMVRHRTYVPVLGRWLERDPIVYSDGPNLYLFVGASPLLVSDASGLMQVVPDPPGLIPPGLIPGPDLPIIKELPVRRGYLGCVADCWDFWGFKWAWNPAGCVERCKREWGSSINIQLCDRNLDSTGADCFDGCMMWLADLCSNHSYLRRNGDDATGLCLQGKPGEKEGDLPSPEVGFPGGIPNCKSCYRNSGILSYGSGAGKDVWDADPSEIWDCIQKSRLQSDYDAWYYNCNHWTEHTIAACGLTCR